MHDRCAVIGGGFLGLALAKHLCDAGRQVTLYEAAHDLGGLAGSWQLGPLTVDRYYHVILMSDTRLRGLLAELDLERQIQWRRTRTGFYIRGKLYSISNVIEFLRFPALSMTSKLRLGVNIFYASRIADWRRLESVPAVDWLRRWSGRRTVDTIWLPLLRAKLGDNCRRVSAAFIWAIIARLYAARRSGLKVEMFGYVPGGYATVLRRFGELLRQKGVELRTGCPAAAVMRESSGGLAVELAGGQRDTFPEVVVTVAAPLAARLCPCLTQEELSRLAGVEYQGVICASILSKRPLAGFYVTNIADGSVPYTAVIEMSALVDREEFGGHSLIYLPKYVPATDAAFALADKEFEGLCLQALCRSYPGFDPADVVCFRVSRDRYVMPIATLDYSAKVPSIATSVPGLYVVNSSQIVNGTQNLNETLQLADRAHAVISQVAHASQNACTGSRRRTPESSAGSGLSMKGTHGSGGFDELLR